MDIDSLSKSYNVRKLGSSDIEMIYHICRENVLFYQYHPPFVTRESIIDTMKARLNGKKAQMLEDNILALEDGFNYFN